LQDFSRKLWIFDDTRYRQCSDHQGDGRERLVSCSFRTGFVELAGNKIDEIQITPRRGGTCRFVSRRKLAAKRSQRKRYRDALAKGNYCQLAPLGHRPIFLSSNRPSVQDVSIRRLPTNVYWASH
jgi:hypothetical protein